MRFVVALVASLFVTAAGFLVLFTTTGDMRAFGWVLLVVGLGGVAVNLVMRSRPR